MVTLCRCARQPTLCLRWCFQELSGRLAPFVATQVRTLLDSSATLYLISLKLGLEPRPVSDATDSDFSDIF